MEKTELEVLVDELVAKGGPTTGQIKANQDLGKVKRLLELGFEPEKKASSVEGRLKSIEEMLDDHEKRIKQNSIQR